ncbi:hypothetical protein HDU93_005676 [Gonapodya sp. JEL0774]|nr:hypothetical protein HDU93_005676 [Gonapodya sp. JEL0774]
MPPKPAVKHAMKTTKAKSKTALATATASLPLSTSNSHNSSSHTLVSFFKNAATKPTVIDVNNGKDIKKENDFDGVGAVIDIDAGEESDSASAHVPEVQNPSTPAPEEYFPSIKPKVPEKKRKAEEAEEADKSIENVPATGKVLDHSAIPTKTSEHVARLQSGRVHFREPKIRYTAQPWAITELGRWHSWVAQQKEVGVTELNEIPDQWLTLVGVIVQDSELEKATLARHVLVTLIPPSSNGEDDGTLTSDADAEPDVPDDPPVQKTKKSKGKKKAAKDPRGAFLTLQAVSKVLEKVAVRKNYGVTRDDGTTNASLSINRWEVHEAILRQVFPASAVEALLGRRARRDQAREELRKQLEEMSEEDREREMASVKRKKKDGEADDKKVKREVKDEMKHEDMQELKQESSDEKKVRPLQDQPPPPNKPRKQAVLGSSVVPVSLPVIGNSGLSSISLAPSSDLEDMDQRERVGSATPNSAEVKTQLLEKVEKVVEKEVDPEKEAKRREREQKKLEKEKRDAEKLAIQKKTVEAKTKQANFLKSFLTKATPPSVPGSVASRESTEVKSESEHRSTSSIKKFSQALEFAFEKQDLNVTVHTWLSTISPAARRCHRTRKVVPTPDVMEIGDTPPTTGPVFIARKKLLQFRSLLDIGVRPAWWGPFTKSSSAVLPRRPFAKDNDLDYDFDSEEEWEDEEGEDLVSEEEEEEEIKGKDAGEEDEEDDWLVPDGYLSEGEGQDVGDSSSRIIPPKSETRPRRLEQLVPIVVGPIWEDEDSITSILGDYQIEYLVEGSLIGIDPFKSHSLNDSEPTDTPPSGDIQSNGSGEGIFTDSKKIVIKKGSQPKTIPPERLSELALFVHGCAMGMAKLTETLLAEKFREVSKTQLEAKIKEFTVKESRKHLSGHRAYFVKDDVWTALNLQAPTDDEVKIKIAETYVKPTPSVGKESASNVAASTPRIVEDYPTGEEDRATQKCNSE